MVDPAAGRRGVVVSVRGSFNVFAATAHHLLDAIHGAIRMRKQMVNQELGVTLINALSVRNVSSTAVLAHVNRRMVLVIAKARDALEPVRSALKAEPVRWIAHPVKFV